MLSFEFIMNSYKFFVLLSFKKEEERRLHEIAAEKHREELEKANTRIKELEAILKSKERDEITKSNARMKSLNEILKANTRANAIAKELEAIVKANNEEIKAELEKERVEFARFKAATMPKVEIVSKLEIALKEEIKRREISRSFNKSSIWYFANKAGKT